LLFANGKTALKQTNFINKSIFTTIFILRILQYLQIAINMHDPVMIKDLFMRKV